MKSLVIILFICGSCQCLGQIGGHHTYDFLGLSSSARTTALGSSQIATYDGDVNLALQSPSLINDQMHQALGVNHSLHLADISYGFSAFGYHLKGINITGILGVTYLDYGDFVRADEFGNRIGEFSGRSLAITAGAGKRLNERISVGANIKWVTSTMDRYSSNGIGLDVGITYQNEEKQTVTTFVARNIGFQLASFNEEREPFPLDIQIGSSRRLKYLPLRISVILHDLQEWNIRSDGLDDDEPFFIDQPVGEPSAISRAIDNFFHHVILGGEFLIGQNEVVRLRFSYNHQLKKELAVSGFRSFNGFGFGFGFKVKKISFDYGFGGYHLAGGMNHLSLSTNLTEWKKM